MILGNSYAKVWLALIPVIILIVQYISAIDSWSSSSSIVSPPIADVEYVLHITPSKGGWILVKFHTYNAREVVLSIGKYMKDVVEITESNVPYSYDRYRGFLFLNTSGKEWVWFNYTFPKLVWYYSPGEGGYLPKRVLMVDVGKDYVQLWPKMVFFRPMNFKPESIVIRLDGILKDWFVIASYSQRTRDLLFFDNYNLFIHSPFFAGKLYKLAKSTADGTIVYFPLFASKLLISDTVNFATYDGTYDIYLSAQYKVDIVARGIHVMSKLLELPPLDYIYMYQLRKTLPEGAEPDQKYITDMKLADSLGVFHDDMIWRIGHILHHYAPIWLNGVYNLEFENVTAPIWYKGMQDYLGYVAASIVTGNPIYNGSLIVPRYLIYLRSFDERRTFMGTHWGGLVYVKYVYAPLAMFYLDSILRNESGGLLNIYKLHGLAVAGRKWQLVSDREVAAILDKEFGIDMSKHFDEVRNFKLNKLMLKEFVERGKWYDYFYSYLDFIREYFTLAPDTIHMVYLEYVAWKSDPEFALYPFNRNLYQSIISDLLQSLPQTNSLTKDELINALNNLTGGKSTDFFEFYTRYAHLNLSVAEVEAFINGTYPRILGKLIAAKKMINALSKAIDVSSLRSELWTAYMLLKAGNYSGAEFHVESLLDEIYKVKYRDRDHDLVPDWVEIVYGTDPYLADMDRDGVNDLYEIFTGRIVIDGDISDWLANSEYTLNVTRSSCVDRNPILGSAIRSMYIARDDKYLYIALEFCDKPYTVQSRLALSFDRDLDMRTSDDRIDLPMSIPRIIGMETLNLGYFGDFVEIRLPLETLQLLGVGTKFMLIVWMDTWGDAGLPYYVSALPRIYLDSLSVEVDLNSLPLLPTDRVIGVPITETITTTKTLTTSITTTVTKTVTVPVTMPVTVTKTKTKTLIISKTDTKSITTTVIKTATETVARPTTITLTKEETTTLFHTITETIEKVTTTTITATKFAPKNWMAGVIVILIIVALVIMLVRR